MTLRLACILAVTAGVVGCGNSLAKPSASEIGTRTADATARLEASEPGQRVLAAIDAHGGLDAWYGGGPVRWTYDYVRLDSLGEPTGSDIHTEQLVDPWSARATHLLMDGSTDMFGWNGTEAWVEPADAELPIDARFWALTPYYFVSMPFVLADPGVQLAAAPADSIEGRPVDVVRVTFEAGTGDAPDDYYDLLLDPDTDRVQGVRYVVSYPAFNPDGGHTPETLMIYDGAQTVEGEAGSVVLQEGFRSFDSASGLPKARGTLTDVRFAPTVRDDAFDGPEGFLERAEP